MKRFVFALLALSVCVTSFSQHLDKKFYPPGVTGLNKFIRNEIFGDTLVRGKDSLRTGGIIFFKITVAKKKIVGISYSKEHPECILESVVKAIQKTDGYWLDKDTTVYLQPVVYIFRAEGAFNDASMENGLRILMDLSNDPDRPVATGTEDDTPLKCIILNPVYWKSEWRWYKK